MGVLLYACGSKVLRLVLNVYPVNSLYAEFLRLTPARTFQSPSQGVCLHQGVLLPGRDHGPNSHLGGASQLCLRQA